mgnify:CR=1 FL=1
MFTEVKGFMYNKKIFDTSVRVLVSSANSCNRNGGVRSFTTIVAIDTNSAPRDRIPEQCKVRTGNTCVGVRIELGSIMKRVRKARNIANITIRADYSISR